MTTGRILVVDDDPHVRMVCVEFLRLQGYDIVEGHDGHHALSVLNQDPHFDIMLLDLKMPGLGGIEVLREVTYNGFSCDVLVMTAFATMENAVECMKLGAYDYIMKPFDVDVLGIKIKGCLQKRHEKQENILLQQKVQEYAKKLEDKIGEIEEAYGLTLEALASAIDAREHNTGGHSRRVARLSRLLGEKLGVTGRDLEDLFRGALLHDVGKIGIRDSILLKPAALTEDEWDEMRQHPEIGYKILRKIDFLKPAAEIVLAHQERFDGKGYPKGLQGDAIPLGARVFSVVDAFDAMAYDRPYRKGLPMEKIVDELKKNSGIQFDPHVVDGFLELIAHYKHEPVQA